MYYPLSQITSNLHTNGGEFAYANTKQEYIGYYYKTSKGEHFTGKTPQDGPNELLITYSKDGGAEITIQNNIYSFVNTDSFEVTKYINITKQSPVAPYPPTYSPTFPTQQDYTNGEMRRYFCKKTNEVIYLEINKDTYDKLKAQNPNYVWQLFTPIKYQWVISGDKKEVFKINKNVTKYMMDNFKLPFLDKFLNENYLRFWKSN